MSNKLVIGIGSNSADKNVQMNLAAQWLSEQLTGMKMSSIYSTPALGGLGDDYLNAVVVGTTTLGADDFNSLAKEYEKSAGRTSESKRNHIVPIDIDIVMLNGKIIREKDFNCYFFQRGYKQLTSE